MAKAIGAVAASFTVVECIDRAQDSPLLWIGAVVFFCAGMILIQEAFE